MIAESRKKNYLSFFLAKKFEKDYLKRFRIISVSLQHFFSAAGEFSQKLFLGKSFSGWGTTLTISIAGIRFA